MQPHSFSYKNAILGYVGSAGKGFSLIIGVIYQEYVKKVVLGV